MLIAAFSLISIFGISNCIAAKYNVSRYLTPIITMCTIGLILYAADVIGAAYFAACLILIFGFHCVLKSLINIKSNSITLEPKWLLVVALIAYVGLANLNNQFSFWDEFSHWGLAAKFLVEDRALIANNKYLYFRDYPPGLQYVGYYFTVIGGYNEGGIIFAASAVAILSFLPIFSFENKKLSAVYILLFSLYIALVMIAGQGFGSALADQQMSAIAMSLMLILWALRGSEHLWLLAAPVGAFLALTKQPGYYIYVLLIGSFGFANFHNIFLGKQRRKIFFIASLVFVTVVWLSWKAFVVSNNIPSSVASANPLQLLKNGASCCEYPYQYKIVKDFLGKLFSRELILIYSFLLIALWVIIIQKNNKLKGSFVTFALAILLGFCVYLLQLLLHYIFAFGVVEGSALASFSRFIMPFVFIFFGLFALSIINYAQNNFEAGIGSKVSRVILFFAFLITIAIAHKLSNVGTAGLIQRPSIVEKLQEIKKFTYKNSSIIIVWQNDGINNSNGLEYWVARQELAPRRVMDGCYSFSPNTITQREGDCIWAEDTFLLNASSYNYIVFLNGIDEFMKKYPSIKIENKNAKYFLVNKTKYNGDPRTVLENVYLKGVEH